MKKLSVIFFIAFVLPIFSFSLVAHAGLLTQTICENGIKLYKQGKYEEALAEFKKALLIEPDYPQAWKYIQIIEQTISPKQETVTAQETLVEKDTDLQLLDLQREVIASRKTLDSWQRPASGEEALPTKILPPEEVLLNTQALKTIMQPFKIEQEKSVFVIGKNIKRFLITNPEIMDASQITPERLLVTGKTLGYAYLHVWDENGRWTLEFLVIPKKPKGPTYAELLRKEEEKMRNFRLGYSFDWASYKRGENPQHLSNVQNDNFRHTFSLSGQSPYGYIDSATTLRTFGKQTEMTYITAGLTNGQVGPFSGFSLRGGDFSPSFANLAFPGSYLRGAMLVSPAFEKKIDYTVFWGQESGGRYGNLSPDLYQSKDAFLEGVNLSFSPTQKQNYKFSILHGYGSDREDYLHNTAYDLESCWQLNEWTVEHEISFDSKNLANLLDLKLKKPNLRLGAQFRNIEKEFLSIVGNGWRQGELGVLFNFDFLPTKKIYLNSRLDIYRDRRYSAEDNPRRFNEEFSLGATYRADDLTTWEASYYLQNNLGKLLPARYQNTSLGVSRTFKVLRDIHTYAHYSHQENKNYSSQNLSYTNERLNAGFRLRLTEHLFYYLGLEYNWLKETQTKNYTMPHAWENGLSWSSRIGESNFYTDLRLAYRDEEDTGSPLSFMSGRDYIEGYAEISYRKDKDKYLFANCRLRHNWREDKDYGPTGTELNLWAGLRFFWDTGLRWDASCAIEGYVFKDLNSDGIRQSEEEPVKGVKIWLGKNKFQITDTNGYYSFKKVRGAKAYVSIDTSTLPQGYLLTVPVRQSINIAQGKTIAVNFGIVCRTEINGVVFVDKNENNEYDSADYGVADVVVVLDGTKQARTDISGRYNFVHLPPGEHNLTLDLESIPVQYLPAVTLTKKITLFEGVNYIYNIPLRETSQN
ncbi:MAG: pilus assembly protein N-terminal domain-containing protein [Candidatus Omnitrophica bacterium]|nr:pilus assembly protein N-terminal domain-containing protein [Candidatus Omnitrophota bacterium]